MSCARCNRSEAFVVEPVLDHEVHIRDTWKQRPVGVRNTEPTGYFATSSCLACGFTAWYARDFASLVGETQLAHCLDCRGTTTHARLPALENSAFGITDVTMVAVQRERQFLGHHSVHKRSSFDLAVCTACSRTTWLLREDLRAGDVVVTAPCFSCQSTSAYELVAVEAEGEPTFVYYDGKRRHGRYYWQRCGGCLRVEWYARELELSATSPVAAIATQQRGPYR